MMLPDPMQELAGQSLAALHGMVTAVFDTFSSKAYKALRRPEPQLPVVMWKTEVNRGDPLATGDMEALRKEHLAFQRE